MKKFILAAVALMLLVIAVIGAGVYYQRGSWTTAYLPSPTAIVPYDVLAMRARMIDTRWCVVQRGGVQTYIAQRHDLLEVAYTPPKVIDLNYKGDGNPYYQVFSAPDVNFCQEGDLLLVGWAAYESSTCIYEMTRGVRPMGHCDPYHRHQNKPKEE